MSSSVLNLNANHRNALLAGFKYIDQLLSEGIAGLTDAEDGAVFVTAIPDATPTQKQVATDLAGRLRQSLRQALKICGLSVTSPNLSALWRLRSALFSIDIAIEELGPSYLRGYGSIDEATAEGIAAWQAQLRTQLSELQKYLESGLGGDLAARLAQLDETTEEVRMLRELERIITTHGLVEFRQPLSHLLERLEKKLVDGRIRWPREFGQIVIA